MPENSRPFHMIIRQWYSKRMVIYVDVSIHLVYRLLSSPILSVFWIVIDSIKFYSTVTAPLFSFRQTVMPIVIIMRPACAQNYLIPLSDKVFDCFHGERNLFTYRRECVLN